MTPFVTRFLFGKKLTPGRHPVQKNYNLKNSKSNVETQNRNSKSNHET